MQAGVAQGRLISPILFSLYINDMPLHTHHEYLAPYADYTVVIVTSWYPTLPVRYLNSYLNDLQRCLSEWRIAINVSKSTAIIFARVRRSFIHSRPVTLFGEPIGWVESTRHLWVTLDRQLAWSPHIDEVRERTAQTKGMLCPFMNRKSGLCQERSPVI